MADHLYHLNPVRAFPSEIDDIMPRVAEIRREFLKNSPHRGMHSLRATIRESWQRCATLIEPGRDEVPIVFASDAELHDLRIRKEPFLRAACPVINRLTEILAGSGYIIGLADGKGRLLRVSGDRPALRGMERIGLAPGGDWSEATAGTNGIGTALVVGHAVAVVGPEHFCEGWQDFTCITVPIRYPCGGKIAGVLDISGDYHLVRPYFTGILAAAALEIKENLKNSIAVNREPMQPFKIAVPAIPGDAVEKMVGKRLVHSNSGQWVSIPTFEGDLQTHIDMQKRRVFAAERLAIAAGTVSASLDVETTLTQVAKQAAHLLGPESAAVCLLDEPGKITFLHAWSRPPAYSGDIIEVIKALVEQTNIVNLLRESGEPVAIDDVHTALHLPAKVTGQPGIRALVLLPLLSACGISGLVAVPRLAPYHWQPDDLRLGLTFAFHAASAVDNARLYQTLQQHYRHVEALNAVNQLLHTLYDPAQQLNLIIERIVDIIGLDGGLILLDRGPANNPVLAAHSGLREAFLTDLYEIASENAANGKSSLLCRQKHEWSPVAEKLHSIGMCDLMIAPLAAGCDVLGVLLVGSRQHRVLTDESLTLFTSIGQQLGLALKNAQLQLSAGETQALREADQIKNRFLMMVSHDLRSPLTAIRTSVESLLDQFAEQSAEAQGHLLQNIAGQAKRLGRLVDRLLDLSRIEAGALPLDRDWTELRALIADTVAKFERLNTPCLIKQYLATNLPLVYVDPERIIQVLWNLLENAHKYAPHCEGITIEALTTGGEVSIRVADRGPGIPKEESEKIFQYFYRLDRERQMHTPGSGLGLAISRGIVDAHGGRIWVESRPGGGSVFCVALPPSLANPVDLETLENQEPINIPLNENVFIQQGLLQ